MHTSRCNLFSVLRRIGHIVNVTREIDNFFPGRFQYLNVRVYDEEATELLKHWDKTFKFIDKAKLVVRASHGMRREGEGLVGIW